MPCNDLSLKFHSTGAIVSEAKSLVKRGDSQPITTTNSKAGDSYFQQLLGVRGLAPSQQRIFSFL